MLFADLEAAMSTTADSEMGKVLLATPSGKETVLVSKCVEVSKHFPSNCRGPVLLVYGIDSEGSVWVQPRVLSVGGVGIYPGPLRIVRNLKRRTFGEDTMWREYWKDRDLQDHQLLTQLAIEHAPQANDA